jgi:hypothetical protein
MSGLHTVGSEQVSSVLLLDQLPHLLINRQRQDQILQAHARRRFDDCVFASLPTQLSGVRRAHGNGIQCSLKAIRQYVVIFSSFLGNYRFDRRTQGGAIAVRAGANNRE